MTMPDNTIVALVKPILDLWVNRDERQAMREAGKLRFWRDGMSRYLKAIADGSASDETFKELRKSFDETKEPVEAAMVNLARVRDRLGLAPLAKQIDTILAYDGIGTKRVARNCIRSLLEFHEGVDVIGGRNAASLAREALEEIQVLNSELDRLYRMIYS